MNIGWLILVGRGMAMAGLFLGGACRSSGDASRCEECALEYRRRVAEFEKRILELETLLAAERDATADFQATGIFALLPDEDDVSISSEPVVIF